MQMIPTEHDAQKRVERLVTAAQLHTGTTNTTNVKPLQASGQLRRAAQLEAQADHRHAFGDWPGARRLLHEARHLRQLAAGRQAAA